MDPSEKKMVMDAVHGDKEIILKGQQENIKKEIEERKKIDQKVKEVIEKEILEVDNKILETKPAGTFLNLSPDVLREVVTLDKEKLGLSKEERDEEKDCWKDVQHLKEEERTVEKELLSSEKKKERFMDILEDDRGSG